MRDHALRVEHNYDVLEIVGTGGDHAHSINISTTAAMIIAAAGVKVAKHGNRAASSKCGAADCLEALGVNLDQPPEKAARELGEIGICFMFAQKYHASMKYVGAIRKELGIRTVFNILGPLTNPAHPCFMLLGVYDEYLLEPLAKVMLSLGVRQGMVVYGQDCLDEISMSAPTSVCEFKNGWFRSYTIKPEDYGFKRCRKEDIRGGDPAENAQVTLDILKGAQGPKTDIVLMNAGAAIYLGGQASSIAEGINRARKLIESGAALKKLEEFKQLSNA
jgi:anthranilate phosphoribosyltransferase